MKIIEKKVKKSHFSFFPSTIEIFWIFLLIVKKSNFTVKNAKIRENLPLKIVIDEKIIDRKVKKYHITIFPSKIKIFWILALIDK